MSPENHRAAISVHRLGITDGRPHRHLRHRLQRDAPLARRLPDRSGRSISTAASVYRTPLAKGSRGSRSSSMFQRFRSQRFQAFDARWNLGPHSERNLWNPLEPVEPLEPLLSCRFWFSSRRASGKRVTIDDLMALRTINDVKISPAGDLRRVHGFDAVGGAQRARGRAVRDSGCRRITEAARAELPNLRARSCRRRACGGGLTAASRCSSPRRTGRKSSASSLTTPARMW